MEIFIFFGILYFGNIHLTNGDVINFGAENIQIEENDYLKKNSFLKLKLPRKENGKQQVYKFKLRLFELGKLYVPIFYHQKKYYLPIDIEDFIETNYSKNKEEYGLLPIEVKNKPRNYFLSGCEYLIPIPTGKYRFLLTKYSNGIGKYFYESYNGTSGIQIEENKTYTVTFKVKEDLIYFEEYVEITDTPKNIKQFENCAYYYVKQSNSTKTINTE